MVVVVVEEQVWVLAGVRAWPRIWVLAEVEMGEEEQEQARDQEEAAQARVGRAAGGEPRTCPSAPGRSACRWVPRFSRPRKAPRRLGPGRARGHRPHKAAERSKTQSESGNQPR